MKPAVLVPVVTTGAMLIGVVLTAIGLSRLPLDQPATRRQLSSPAPPVQVEEPPAVVLPRPTPRPEHLPMSAAPVPNPTPIPSDQGSDDARLYNGQITYLETTARDASRFAEEFQKIGSLDKAMSTLKDASQNFAHARCLKNQQRYGMPYYQAEVTCKAATKDG